MTDPQPDPQPDVIIDPQDVRTAFEVAWDRLMSEIAPQSHGYLMTTPSADSSTAKMDPKLDDLPPPIYVKRFEFTVRPRGSPTREQLADVPDELESKRAFWSDRVILPSVDRLIQLGILPGPYSDLLLGIPDQHITCTWEPGDVTFEGVKVKTKIIPTVGRVLWFYPGGRADHEAKKQPLSASVAYVHDDSRINIGYLDANGHHCQATSVLLVQEGEELPRGPFCCWMPYQVGQAAKTEQTEAKIGGDVEVSKEKMTDAVTAAARLGFTSGQHSSQTEPHRPGVAKADVPLVPGHRGD